MPAARSVLFDGVADLDRAARSAGGGRRSTTPPPPGSWSRSRCDYDGPDLADVAQRWGLSVDDAVRAHAAVEYLSAFCGFAPGFSYLAGLPEELRLPRLDTPRPRVPAGAVGLAGEWCAAYPTASPGGWRLLGHTDARLWDATRQPPALLPPGTRVRFLPQ